MAHYKPPHLDLYCLQIQLFLSQVLKELKQVASDRFNRGFYVYVYVCVCVGGGGGGGEWMEGRLFLCKTVHECAAGTDILFISASI